MLAFSPVALLALAFAFVGPSAAAAASTVTVTVTVAPAAVTVKSTVTKTSLSGTSTVTKTAIATKSAAVVTSTALKSVVTTSTLTHTGTTTSTTTSIATAPTSTTTVTSTYTSTTHASAPTSRNAYSLYFGCIDAQHLADISGTSWSITRPVPFTASTAVQECYYKLSAATDVLGTVPNVCGITNNPGLGLYKIDLDVAAPLLVDDSFCNVDCTTINGLDATNGGYGLEYCGGTRNSYSSLYTLAALS